MNDRTSPETSEPLAQLDPRVRQRCEVALIKAINAFPGVLRECEPELTAVITAIIITVLMSPSGSQSLIESSAGHDFS